VWLICAHGCLQAAQDFQAEKEKAVAFATAF
jgi:hypothetical protein